MSDYGGIYGVKFLQKEKEEKEAVDFSAHSGHRCFGSSMLDV